MERWLGDGRHEIMRHRGSLTPTAWTVRNLGVVGGWFDPPTGVAIPTPRPGRRAFGAADAAM